jgi:hypothetical protein
MIDEAGDRWLPVFPLMRLTRLLPPLEIPQPPLARRRKLLRLL